MMNWKESLKVLVKASFIVTSRIVFYTGLGVFINLVFVVAFFSNIKIATTMQMQGSLSWILFVLALGMFLLIFPFLYFLTSKGYGITKGLQFIFKQNKHYIFDYLAKQIVEKYPHLPGKEKMNTGMQFTQKADRRLDNIKGPGRLFIRFILNRVPLYEALSEISKTTEFKEENLPEISKQLLDKLGTAVEENILDPSLLWYIIVLIANTILIGLVIWQN